MEIRPTFHYRGKEYDLDETPELLVELETAAESIQIEREARAKKRRTMTQAAYNTWSDQLNASWIMTRKTIRRLRLWMNQSQHVRKDSHRLRHDAALLDAEEQILVDVYGVLHDCYVGGKFTSEHFTMMETFRDLLRAKGIGAKSIILNARGDGRFNEEHTHA